MKKFFTLIAALFAVIAVNADEVVLCDTTITFTNWGSSYALSDGGKELTEAGAVAGDEVAFYVTGDEGWQMKVNEGHWAEGVEDYGFYTASDVDGTGAVTLTLTEDMLTRAATVQYWGGVFVLSGDKNVVVSKITLRKAGVDASEKKVIPLSFSNIAEDGTCEGEYTWCQIDLTKYNEETESFDYDYSDATGYDYAVLEFENTTVGGAFKVYKNDWNTTVDTTFVAGSNYIAIPLSKAEGWVDQLGALVIQKQSAETGIIKVIEVAYMTEKGYQQLVAKYAEVVKEKDLPLPGEDGVVAMLAGVYDKEKYSAGDKKYEGGAGWNSAGWQGMEGLGTLYKTFVVEFTAEHEFRLCAQNWPAGNNLEVYPQGTKEKQVIAFAIGEGEDELQGLGQYAVTNKYITEYVEPYVDPTTGEQVDESTYGANTVTITRAYVTSEVVESTFTPWVNPYDGIAEIKAENAKAGVMYNVAGQRVSSANGLVIMNGKKLVK